MILSGKIYDSEGVTLPAVNVFVSDSQGNFKAGSVGVSGDLDGNYRIEVQPTDYVTASFVGIGKKTFLASDVCKTNSCKFDITLGGGGITLPIFEVVARQKPDWKRIAFISAGSLLAVAGIILSIKYLRK